MSRHNTLDERIVLVPGGTGNVGEGIVRSLLDAGANVVVPSSSTQRLESLRDLIGSTSADRLIGLVAPYDTFEGAEQLADTVRKQVGTVTDVVSLIGGWWAGKSLWEVSEEDWQRVFVSPATTGVALVRAFVPGLDRTGSYTTVAGFSAQVPTAGSGPVSMQGAAQLMMRRVLSEEIGTGARINDVMLGPIINRSRPQGRADWLTADQVGDVVARIVADPAVRDTLVDVQDKASYETFLGL